MSARVGQLNFVVRDAVATKAAWRPILGEPLAEYFVQGPDVYRAELDGVPVDCSDVLALKWAFGDLDIEALRAGRPLASDVFFLAFWQPGERDTPWRRHLDTYGEGLMDLEMEVADLDAFAEQIGRRPFHVGRLPGMVSALFQTQDTLHVGLNITARETGR